MYRSGGSKLRTLLITAPKAWVVIDGGCTHFPIAGVAALEHRVVAPAVRPIIAQISLLWNRSHDQSRERVAR